LAEALGLEAEEVKLGPLGKGVGGGVGPGGEGGGTGALGQSVFELHVFAGAVLQ
jgi:hypothetical protein